MKGPGRENILKEERGVTIWEEELAVQRGKEGGGGGGRRAETELSTCSASGRSDRNGEYGRRWGITME